MRYALLLMSMLLLAPPAGAVDVGDRAPGFKADSTAGTIRLDDYAGRKNVVLAFYYNDFRRGDRLFAPLRRRHVEF